jgi:hypothetical protein
VDYGVESQVNTRLSPDALSLDIAIINQISSLPIWSWFVSRLGRVAWSFEPSVSGESNSARLRNLLLDAPPQIVLIENIKLRPNNPVWSTPGVLLVVSLVPWRPS